MAKVRSFFVDIIPITAIVVAIAYQFSELDDVFLTHVRDRNNLPATAQFLTMQKAVNESSFVIYILYSAIMESSRHQATVGKILFRMRVINAVGGRLSFKNALGRNWSKLFSWFALCLGFIAILLSRTKQAWHDKIAKTYVIVD